MSASTLSHIPFHYSLVSDLPDVAFKTSLLLKDGPFRRKCHIALQGGLRAGLRKVADKAGDLTAVWKRRSFIYPTPQRDVDDGVR